MLSLLLATPLLAPLAQSPPPPPAPERVAGTLADLSAAYETDDPKAIAAALQRSSSTPHPKVVKAVAKALDDERPEVRQAAVTAYRYMDHDDALKRLHRLVKDSEWMKDKELSAATLRAIGQHRDVSSLKLLFRGHDRTPHPQAVRARILGLGNIRHNDSIDALIELMSLGSRNGNPNAERRYAYLDNDFRLSLIVLTGIDQGTNPELWSRWWRKNRKGFEMTKEPVALPRSLRYRWDSYWGRQATYGREEEREDRGK